jgi:tRNA 2-thiocytidine biosynthesis protein TtcA
MFTSLQNVVPSHLMDVNRYDFKNIKITGQADADGDKVFDEEEFPLPRVAGLQVVQL